MLRVEYEATGDLEPGQLVQIEEDRGLISIRIDQGLGPIDYTAALNDELKRFLAGSEWFQLWKDQIVSPQDSESPVRALYRIDVFGELDDDATVEIRERKGLVEILVDPTADVHRFVAAINPAIKMLLAGGQWFQHWRGEIVDLMSPETVSRV